MAGPLNQVGWDTTMTLECVCVCAVCVRCVRMHMCTSVNDEHITRMSLCTHVCLCVDALAPMCVCLIYLHRNTSSKIQKIQKNINPHTHTNCLHNDTALSMTHIANQSTMVSYSQQNKANSCLELSWVEKTADKLLSPAISVVTVLC